MLLATATAVLSETDRILTRLRRSEGEAGRRTRGPAPVQRYARSHGNGGRSHSEEAVPATQSSPVFAAIVAVVAYSTRDSDGGLHSWRDGPLTTGADTWNTQSIPLGKPDLRLDDHPE